MSGVFARRGYTLTLLMLVYAFSVLDRFILGILLPQIKQEMALNDAVLGLLTGAAFAVFYATLGLPIARLAERYSRKLIIAICLAIFSVMTTLCGFANGFWMLFLARIGVGIGEAGTTPASTSMLSDLYAPAQRSGALAFMSLGGNISILVGFVVGGYIAATYGWRTGFFVIGVPGLLLALVIYLTLPEPARGAADGKSADQTPPDVWQTLAYLRQRKSYMFGVIGLTIMVGLTTSVLTWMPSFLVRSHGMVESEVGLIMGLSIGILGAFGTLVIGGLLANKLVARDLRWGLWVPAMGALVLVPAYAAMVAAPTAMLALAAYLLPALMGIFFQGSSMALFQSVTPVAMRATSAALVLFVANLLGLGLGPLSIGVLSDALTADYGNDGLRYALGVVPIAAACAAWFFFRAAHYARQDVAAADAYV